MPQGPPARKIRRHPAMSRATRVAGGMSESRACGRGGHDFLDPGHLGREHGHERGARVGGPATGDVAAHAVQRARDAACQDALGHLNGPHLALELGPVEAGDVPGRCAEGLNDPVLHPAVGRLDLLGGDLQASGLHLLPEAPQPFHHGRIAPLPHVLNEPADVVELRGDVLHGTPHQGVPFLRREVVNGLRSHVHEWDSPCCPGGSSP